MVKAHTEGGEGQAGAVADDDDGAAAPSSPTGAATSLTVKQRVVDTILRAVIQGLLAVAVLWIVNRATAPPPAKQD